MEEEAAPELLLPALASPAPTSCANALSLYYKKVRKVISDSILETPCTDYCDKYFLFMFSMKAVKCCAQVVNLKLPADGAGDGKAMSRHVDGGPSAAFINLGT